MVQGSSLVNSLANLDLGLPLSLVAVAIEIQFSNRSHLHVEQLEVIEGNQDNVVNQSLMTNSATIVFRCWYCKTNTNNIIIIVQLHIFAAQKFRENLTLKFAKIVNYFVTAANFVRPFPFVNCSHALICTALCTPCNNIIFTIFVNEG